MEITKNTVITYTIKLSEVHEMILQKINRKHGTKLKSDDELLDIDINSTIVTVEVQ